MKTYLIPVSHTATTVVEHRVEAKNMQDAMFRLGTAISDTPDPFECVTAAGISIEVEVRPGVPQIVEDEQLPLEGGLDEDVKEVLANATTE